MDRGRAEVKRSALIAMALSACATAPRPSESPVSPIERDGITAWFAIHAKCEAVSPTLGVSATLREGEASPWKTGEQGKWCVVGTRAGLAHLRLDSVTARSSLALNAGAVSFYVADMRWSYTVFEAGEEVFNLESHVGEPAITGDALRAGRVLGIDSERLESTLGQARDLKRFGNFCKELGLEGFGADDNGTLLFLGAPEVIRVEEKVNPERTLSRIPPGTWAALPPLGVILVKGVEPRTKDDVTELHYLIVSGMSAMELPVVRAEKMGMRPLVKEEEARAILKRLDEGFEAPPKDYDASRVKGWLDALKAGALEGIAEVYGTLCALSGERKLYQVESGLLGTSLEWLSAETAVVLGKTNEEMEKMLTGLCD